MRQIASDVRTARKERVRDFAEQMAPERDRWIARNRAYYEDDARYMRFLVPEGLRVLELGCGTGVLLDSLKPAYGIGVDLSPHMVEIAQHKYPHLNFVEGDVEDRALLESLEGPFDAIILSDTIGYLTDCEETFLNLRRICSPDTRLIVTYISWFWEPVLTVGEKLGLKSPTPELSWLSTDDTIEMLRLANFESVKREWRQIVPRRLFGLGRLINRYIGTLPTIRRACLRNYLVVRPLYDFNGRQMSTSVVIPCRNECGNVKSAVERLPRFCPDMEIIFVEGGSRDGTWEEIQRVIKAYPEWDIKAVKQDGIGKGDAVRKGFDLARGEVLMILDADLTVPPEDLPKFYRALVSGKGEFINGTRLVYPMEHQAMRFLNFWANRFFSLIFAWLLNQRITDTLCGTKVLTKTHYRQILANRAYFGDFDPFGDFDLIFGAAKLNLKTVEIPIRYAAREYGETQISRFRHGLLLLRMVVFAYRKMKAT